jgi:hypothetical protein
VTVVKRHLVRAGLWLHGWLTRRLFKLEQVATDIEYGDLVRLKVLPNSADAFVVLAVNLDAAALAVCPIGYDANDIVHCYALRDVERLPRFEVAE